MTKTELEEEVERLRETNRLLLLALPQSPNDPYYPNNPYYPSNPTYPWFRLTSSNNTYDDIA
jgi:hypothetical protein